MKLRIYAVIVTLALVAALTNPSEQNHHAKLSAAYPWVSESLLADDQIRVYLDEPANAPHKETEENLIRERNEPPQLSYWNYGIASAVTSYPRYVLCPTGVTPTLLSFGLFGFVFLKHFPTVP
jgi:hypothetical protein